MHATASGSSGAREAGVAVRRLIIALVGALILATATGPSLAANKAFVVGNATYAHADALTNPANDARDFAARLTSLGYEVSLELDAPRAGLLAAFQAFTRGLAQDDLALFYFAGHALQIGGENYLFPSDARLDSDKDVGTRLVPLNALLADLTRASRTRIVILDACRNNPFSDELAAKLPQTRSTGGLTRGLARVYAGVGSFIAYSTQPGNTALDGDGRNSPFTGALLKHMAEPGIDVHGVMRRVRADVQKATLEKQIPWENSSLVDEVAFRSGGGAPQPAGPPSSPRTQPSPAASPQSAERRPAETYSYVTGLDPSGDNFLALRAAPGGGGQRIATMGPDTLLKVVEASGSWRRVVLLDGTSGWAHGNWIACCRSLRGGTSVAPANSVRSTADTCDDLWNRRNAIWHRHKYCFTTERGQRAFGNVGCSRDQAAARAAMSEAEQAEVDALVARERAQSCK